VRLSIFDYRKTETNSDTDEPSKLTACKIDWQNFGLFRDRTIGYGLLRAGNAVWRFGVNWHNG